MYKRNDLRSRSAVCIAIVTSYLTLALCGRLSATGIERLPHVAVVVGKQAPELEQFAARELAGMLERLFEISVTIQAMDDVRATTQVLVGRPVINPSVGHSVGDSWPQISDQGLILRHLKASIPTFVVGGGSATATLWAVYELGKRLGVRYLQYRDSYPSRRKWTGLPKLDLVMEPNMRIRCWRLVNDLPHRPVSWSQEENCRFLHQIAKMKYNRIHVALWPTQPFVHYQFRGMSKPPGVLYFGLQHPIDDDTIGRSKFQG